MKCRRFYVEPILDFDVLALGFIFLFLFCSSASAAATIPTAQDINSISETAQQIYDNFMQQSFELRLKYEFSDTFISDADREKLYEFAKTASGKLAEIEEEQKKLKKYIEDYEADDWDDKYGSTGLWRKLVADIYFTILSKCDIDFFEAVFSAGRQIRTEILHTIIERLDSLEEIHDSAYLHFIKARVYALLAQDDLLYRPLAKREFGQLLGRSDIGGKFALRVETEQIRLLGEAKAGRLDAITEAFVNSDFTSDIELALSLAFLQRRFDRHEAFERILLQCPQTQDFVGSFLLSELFSRMQKETPLTQIFQDITVFEAELIAKVLWKENSKEHKDILPKLVSVERFQTPLILYVTAIKSAETEPAKAVELLIAAGRLQKKKRSVSLGVEAEELAKQAAQLAYEKYLEGSLDCNLVLEAFENYLSLAKEEFDGRLEYCYVYVLKDCNCPEKSKEVLQNLANENKGYWSCRAKLDLIKQDIEVDRSRDKYTSDELFLRLKNFIVGCSSEDKESKKLRAEAIAIYCRLLLERNDEKSAKEVVNVLTGEYINNDPNLFALKSTALHRLGDLCSSAVCLLKACQQSPCRYTYQAMALLSDLIEDIDRLHVQKDEFLETIETGKKLAQICCSCVDDSQKKRAILFLAEISVFAAKKEDDKLAEAEQLLAGLSADSGEYNIDIMRCRARLLTEERRFEEAAKLWSRICIARQAADFSSNKRSWQWWRAKYYELFCCLQMPDARKHDLLHTIDVLEGTYKDIPVFWAEKLKALTFQNNVGLSSQNR